METPEAAFAERMSSAVNEWTLERQSLRNVIAELRNSADRRELLTEIVQTEAALRQVGNNIEKMLNQPAVEISELVRTSARETELQAYLRGLTFKAHHLSPPLTSENETHMEEVEHAIGAGA